MQPPFPQGFVLKGRYAVRSTIGQGGMGRTYLCLLYTSDAADE